ncbi:MAG: nucleotidyltransferase family protein [Methylacidiphilaceae bacterium]|nr:nucleotidyltransferase family protein [Candidatus Methylacidiphilaceae bacterium]
MESRRLQRAAGRAEPLPKLVTGRLPSPSGQVKMTDVEELISAILRGENPRWPADGLDGFAARFLERSAYHGVQALVHHHWRNETRRADLGYPEAVWEACRKQALAQAMWEMRHRELLGRVLPRLSEVDARPIVFKGTALAYDLYPAPFLRARADTDLLVPAAKREPAIRALEDCGFSRVPNVSGEFVTYEAGFVWRDARVQQAHVLDLHWRISNSKLLANLFSYEDLRARARKLPALSEDALGVEPVTALVLACMHRAVHKQAPYYVDGVAYRSEDRLIWLYDIHCLLGRLSPAQHREFVELAERKGLAATCQAAVERARVLFHSAVPENADWPARNRSPEPADRYLDAPAAYQFRADLRAIAGVRNKLKFLSEIFFPPESWMRRKYSGAKPGWLPWLYLRRAGEGLWKSLRRRTG